MKKSFPTGVSDYAKLRTEGYYIVDKTLILKEFLERKSEVTLITRPRRFGKTSNMSMMAEFFDITKNSKKLFENTNIMKTECSKEMNQYPTIFLSFANCKGDYKCMVNLLFENILKAYEPYEQKFQSMLNFPGLKRRVLKMYQALQDGENIGVIASSIQTLSEFLYKSNNKRVMIFIDEYDTPFIEAHVGGYYNEIKNDLSLMLQSALKDNKFAKYAMLTGIQRVAKENIFSHLNNVKVCSVHDEAYTEYFGFTTEETKVLLETYSLDLNDEVKAMYDGYNMGGVEIYNPWSIINYADQKQLISYWANTSSNEMIKDAINHSDSSFHKSFEKLIQDGFLDTETSLNTSFYEVKGNSNLWGLLVNAGYLTIEETIDLSDEIYRLRIPNREVLREFKSLTASYLQVSTMELKDLYEGLKNKDKEKFLSAYEYILMSNPSYHDFKSENSYHMFLLGICLYMQNDYEVISNREAGTGRCDIILKAKTSKLSSYILEFKYTKTETDLALLATKAVEQINERKYDHILVGSVIYVGLAHYGKEVEMVWKDKEG